MKKTIALIVVVILCLTMAACTNKGGKASVEPTQLVPNETDVVHNTEHSEETFAKEEIENSNHQKVTDDAAVKETIVNETVHAETSELTSEKVNVDETGESNTVPSSPVVEDGVLKPNSEYGSPGIDD